MLKRNQLNVEDEGCIWRNDISNALLAICEAGRACKLNLVTNLHLRDSLIPSLDDLTRAECEGKLFSTGPGGIEHLAVGKGTSIVDADLAPSGWNCSSSSLDYFETKRHLN